MKIGIDIDGVLIDYTRFMYDYGSKFCVEKHLPLTIKPNGMDEAIFGWDEQVTEEFWNTYLKEYVTNCPARNFASEVIQKLKEKHEIYIVTARNEEGLPPENYGKMREFTKQWLEAQNIPYDAILYTKRGNKLKDCIENGVQLIVEDEPANIEELKENLTVFCYDCPYNQQVEGKHVIRVYSWYDILSKIETIENIEEKNK